MTQPAARPERTSAALVDVLGDLAALGTPEEAEAALPAVLGRLAEAAGAEACQLDTATSDTWGAPTARWQTAVNLGYPSEVSAHLGGAFMTSRHGQLVMAESRALRIGAEDPHEFRSTGHFREVLAPAGYDDGISIALRSPAPDVVGMLHLSAPSVRDFRTDAVSALPALGRALARVTRMVAGATVEAALPVDFAAVRMDVSGRRHRVLGRAPLHLQPTDELCALVRGFLDSGAESLAFLHHQGGALVEVRLQSRPADRAARACLVATRSAVSPLGLTLRQLEVLTAVASGAGNREIAEELCLTQRTVAAHVEAILARLGVPSRAGAAAMAMLSGALLLSADPTSVRGVARVTRRPLLAR